MYTMIQCTPGRYEFEERSEMSQQADTATTDPSAGNAAYQGPALVVENLRVSFATYHGELTVVDGVSLEVQPGRILGIIGESGSGKSVTARAIMGLLPKYARIGGSILLNGRQIIGMPEEELCRLRGKEVAMIFQDPMHSLNPTQRIGRQLVESIRVHEDVTKAEARSRGMELLESVNIPNLDHSWNLYPHQMSGGMQQRVMIAMALSCNPSILIADEATTALDVTTQAQILELLKELQVRYNLTVILVSHDLGLAARYTDDVAIVYSGEVVETGTTEQVFNNMVMPYTYALFRSIPKLSDTPGEKLAVIPGSAPKLADVAGTCPFHPRCERARDLCRQEKPALRPTEAGHFFSCWYPIGGSVDE